MGITVLFNQATVIATPNRQFELVGTGDLWAGQCKPPPASKANLPRLVLAHNPDSKEVMRDDPGSDAVRPYSRRATARTVGW